MVTYQEESFSEIQDELDPLFELHWNEIDKLAEEHPLNVNYEAYEQLEKAGVLHTVTGRDGDRLIGYVISLLAPSLHCQDIARAINDVLFVHPDYRKGGIFSSMLKFAELRLKEQGMAIMYIHVKTDYDFSPILEHYGYTEIERNFEKQL